MGAIMASLDPAVRRVVVVMRLAVRLGCEFLPAMASRMAMSMALPWLPGGYVDSGSTPFDGLPYFDNLRAASFFASRRAASASMRDSKSTVNCRHDFILPELKSAVTASSRWAKAFSSAMRFLII